MDLLYPYPRQAVLAVGQHHAVAVLAVGVRVHAGIVVRVRLAVGRGAGGTTGSRCELGVRKPWILAMHLGAAAGAAFCTVRTAVQLNLVASRQPWLGSLTKTVPT